jgi:WD40 repeat protein
VPSALAYSPDGRWLAGGCYSPAVVKVWDAANGKELFSFGGHRGNLTGASFTPDGRRLVTSDWQGNVLIWSLQDKKGQLGPFAHKGHACGIACSPDNVHLATSGADRTVRIWNMATATEERLFRAPITALVYSPDGRCLAGGGADGIIKVWDAADDREVRSFPVGPISPRGPVFSSDGSWLAVADGQRTYPANQIKSVTLWNLPDGRLRRTLTGNGHVLNGIALHAPTQMLATAGADRTVKLWDAATGRLLWNRPAHADEVNGVALSADGKVLASVGKDGAWKLWDAFAGRELLSRADPRGELLAVAFSRQGARLAFAGAGKIVHVWDASARRPLLELRGHTDTIRCLAWSPDGDWLVSGGDDQTVRLWDLQAGREACCLRGHTGSVGSVAFSPHGHRLVTGCLAEHAVKVWGIPSGKELLTLPAPAVSCVAFTPDGGALLAGCYAGIRIWETSTLAAETKTQRLNASRAGSGLGFHTLRGNWREAVADFARLFPSEQEDPETASSQAALLLLAGKRAQYADACRRLMQRCEQTGDARAAYLLARACTLDVAPPVDTAAVVSRVQKAVDANPRLAWFRHALGLAHYRAGSPDQAIVAFRISLETDPNWGALGLNWLALALCHHRAGREKEARDWLQKADKWFEEGRQALPRTAEWGLWLHPHDWLSYHLLHAEAERLMPPPPVPRTEG